MEKILRRANMKAILILSVALLLAGCNSQYRYPCQDPANWGKAECNNEICKAEGECTSDVLEPKAAEELIEDGLIEDATLNGDTGEE
jgi:hypothetical protein